MINDKIDELIGELGVAVAVLVAASLKGKTVTVKESIEKVTNVSIKLSDLISEIEETEKAIDGCRVRILEMCDGGFGDCGTDENGLCNGYYDEDAMCKECGTCEYRVKNEEE